MVFETKAVKVDAGESDHFDGDVNKESKRKCGRPTKVQGNFGFEKKKMRLKQERVITLIFETRKEANHMHGIPPKMHGNDGFETNWALEL